jgi:hypothetical protein
VKPATQRSDHVLARTLGDQRTTQVAAVAAIAPARSGWDLFAEPSPNEHPHGGSKTP